MKKLILLIPEWNQVSQNSDTQQVNKTARFLLQGRKFGLGCILITQRTANVTKTILNQCNSIFAMQSFDQTGLDFLSNYMGSEYAHTEELQNEFGVRNITFMDDAFTINKKRLHEFCTQLLERKIDISWNCLTRIDHIDDETIKILKRAGCTKVSVGIESGNDRILQLMDKKLI